jgi:N-acyl-D-aspartate/D-glutamate deacylase
MLRSPLLLAAATLVALVGASPSAGQTYDVVIRDARVVDGSGNPWYRADIAIDGDRIAAVGRLAGAIGRREIDASGLFAAPGFIDTHSHASAGLASADRSHARPILAQGVTTVFVNPDGGGEVDLRAQADSLLRDGLGVNVAQLVPHGSVRSAVLGMADRAPTPDELDRMRALVREGMEAGAWGMSSGPFYAPGSYSDTDELIALAREVAPWGGAYTSHVRDESDYTIGVVASLDEVIAVAREAGIPGVHTHIKVLGPPVWGFSQALVARIERARAEGVEVYADQYPYLASATGLAPALLPRWAQADGPKALQERLADPATRARIRADMEENLARRGGADRIQFRYVEDLEEFEGRRLSDLAEAWGVHPLDAALRLFDYTSPSIVSYNMHEDDVRRLMVQPWTMTASDGSLPRWQSGVPHPRAYGAFSRKLRHYVVEEGVVTLEHAIRSMTSLPATVFRMPDRGRIAPGAVADLVLFDLERVRDVATFTDPHHLSEGMSWVFVGGTAAVEEGEFTGALAGRVLRKR